MCVDHFGNVATGFVRRKLGSERPIYLKGAEAVDAVRGSVSVTIKRAQDIACAAAICGDHPVLPGNRMLDFLKIFVAQQKQV